MSQLNDIMTQLTDGVTALPAVKKVYNYLSDLSDGQPYPRVEVLNGNEVTVPEDGGAATMWESQFELILMVYAAPDVLESIITDLRRYLVSVYISQINATVKWNILFKKGLTVSRNNNTTQDRILWSGIKATVHSRFMDVNL